MINGEGWRRQWQPTQVPLPGKSHGWRSLVGCIHGVSKSWTRLSDFTFTFHFHAWEKEMATHFSILAWRIPGTEEPAAAAAAAKSLQSCPTLCDPIDGSPPGSLVPGILQARTLEWVAISFSNAWKWKVKLKSFSRAWLLVTPWTAAYQAPPSVGFSRQEYWSGVPLMGYNSQDHKESNTIEVRHNWSNLAHIYI